ncbi:PPK2 family polyphosphate kinase [Nocardioides sp.]|uniref:PPK2 family polyphosphate kinase n=1 Tax=Nocardioides sp. TaxID=35761 RepID=UPI002ED93DEE
MTAHAQRLPSGSVDLASIPTDRTRGFSGAKKEGKQALVDLGPELSELQERLYAHGRKGSARRILLVLQGMDTSGKGGTLRHTVGLVDPQGVRIMSFKAPTEEERAHDFLWRIRRALPGPGIVGVFDRSHYEDVLVPRVHGLVDETELERRYAAINDFERELTEGGTTILKCLLHISPDEQKKRLLARLAQPSKHWKYNPHDVDERARWADYRRAYEIAVERTNTDVAPWYLLPSDSKWYRNLAIGELLLETLRGFDLDWPAADFDVDAERARLTGETPVA